MSQAAAPVPVRVQQLSGQELVATSLDPSTTVHQLRAEVERRLGVTALQEVQLCLGVEQVSADASVAQLAARSPDDGAVVLDAVVTNSTDKADAFSEECLRLYDQFNVLVEARVRLDAQIDVLVRLHDQLDDSMTRVRLDDQTGALVEEEGAALRALGSLLEKYAPALELLHGMKEDIPDGCPLLVAIYKIDGIYAYTRDTFGDTFWSSSSAIRFIAVSGSLLLTRVHEGERQFKDPRQLFEYMFPCDPEVRCRTDESFYRHDVFTEPTLAAMKDTGISNLLGQAWTANLIINGERPPTPRQAEEQALRWMAGEHPQAAVREAARGLQLSGRLAAAAPPPRGHSAAEAPEQQRPCARGGAAEGAHAAVVEGEGDGALAAAASDEREVEQMAEAVAQSEAEAIQQEQAQLQEALLRSKEGWAPPAVDVVVLKYNHRKSWLHDGLLGGVALQEERDALEAAGFEPTLRSGAKIFVPPGVYAAVAEFFDEGWDLKCSHVVVSAELESKVQSAVEAAHKAAPRSERGSNKIMDRKVITVSEDKTASDASVELSEETVEYQVVRTFVQIPVFNSMRSASSFQPWSV